MQLLRIYKYSWSRQRENAFDLLLIQVKGSYFYTPHNPGS